MAWGHSTGTSHCITRSGYFQLETLPPSPPLRSHTNEGTGRGQPGAAGRNEQAEGTAGDKKGLLSWHGSRQHQRKSCETANFYKAGSGEAPRPWCNDRGVPAAQLLLAAFHPTVLPQQTALNPTIKRVRVKGKTHREGEGKPLGGKGNRHRDAVQSKGWQAAGPGLTAAPGWEGKGGGGNPKPARLPKPLLCRQSLLD